MSEFKGNSEHRELSHSNSFEDKHDETSTHHHSSNPLHHLSDTLSNNLPMAHLSISQIHHDGDYIILDNKKFRKQDLVKAFGGQMNPGWTVPSVHKFGNPAPLGLSAFAYCTFVASLINCRAHGLSNDSVNNGPGMFYGGLIQLIAGLWEISLENAFGGLAFCSFGGYWMGAAANKIPWFNADVAYASAEELNIAMGFYYLGWTVFCIILLACTIKSTILFFLLFVLVFLRLMLLTIFRFYNLHSAEVAAGVIGVMAALLAWYHAYAGLATPQNSYYVVEPMPMPVIGRKNKELDEEEYTDSQV